MAEPEDPTPHDVDRQGAGPWPGHEDAALALNADVEADTPPADDDPGVDAEAPNPAAEIDSRAITWEEFHDQGPWHRIPVGEVMQSHDYIQWAENAFIEVVPEDAWYGERVGEHLHAFRTMAVRLDYRACTRCETELHADEQELCGRCRRKQEKRARKALCLTEEQREWVLVAAGTTTLYPSGISDRERDDMRRLIRRIERVAMGWGKGDE
jgi:hypothetical protein